MTYEKDSTVVIFASGSATRLGNILPVGTPKCMLEFEGTPFIDYLLSWIFRAGIEKVVITVSVINSAVLQKHIAERWKCRNIEIVMESRVISPTVSVLAGLRKVDAKYSFVMTADNLWEGASLSEMLQMLVLDQADGLVAVDANPGPNFGMVKIRKPNLIVSMLGNDHEEFDSEGRTTGLYLAETEAIVRAIESTPKEIRESVSIERDPFLRLRRVVAYLLTKRCYDFGTPANLEKLRENPQWVRDAFGDPMD